MNQVPRENGIPFAFGSVVYRACLTALEDSVKAPLAQPEVREVMDIRQAAHYLGISADSLYRYAATGFIPAFRLGNRWRFRKSRLDEWMDRRSGVEESASPRLVRVQQKKPVRSTRVLNRSSRTGS